MILYSVNFFINTENAENLLSAQRKYVIDSLLIMLKHVLGQFFLWTVLVVWGLVSQQRIIPSEGLLKEMKKWKHSYVCQLLKILK